MLASRSVSPAFGVRIRTNDTDEETLLILSRHTETVAMHKHLIHLGCILQANDSWKRTMSFLSNASFKAGLSVRYYCNDTDSFESW